MATQERKPTIFELRKAMDFIQTSTVDMSQDLSAALEMIQATADKALKFVIRRVGPSAGLVSHFQTLASNTSLIHELGRFTLEGFASLINELKYMVDPAKQQFSRFRPHDKDVPLRSQHYTHGLDHCSDALLNFGQRVLSSLNEVHIELQAMEDHLAPDFGRDLMFAIDQIRDQVKGTRRRLILQVDGMRAHLNDLRAALDKFGNPDTIQLD